jgi:hypothetical protein
MEFSMNTSSKLIEIRNISDVQPFKPHFENQLYLGHS